MTEVGCRSKHIKRCHFIAVKMAFPKSILAHLLIVLLFGFVFGDIEVVDNLPGATVDKIVRRVEETQQRTSADGKRSVDNSVFVTEATTQEQIRSEKVIVDTSERRVQQVVETVPDTNDADDPVLKDDPQPAAIVDDGLAADVKDTPRPAPRDGQILLDDWAFILIVVACVAVGVLGIAIAFLCWYKIQTTNKAQSEAEYPAYGLTGPSSQVASNLSNGDRKLAQSAQMYHYQHQKQQMIAMEKREKGEVQGNAESDYDSEEENEDGDLTVYECPGLAPTGEMQVKNPLFTEDHRSEASSQPEEKQ